MVAGGDSGQRDMGERQQVTEAFASSIVLKAHRLADYIQSQLARHLSFARKPFLPAWLPNHRTLATAQWAERVVSRVYDTIQSLPGIRHVASTASVEPSPFVWFQPNRAWPGMPQEDEYIETEQGPAFEATPFTAEGAESSQPRAPRRDGQGDTVSSPHNDAIPRTHRPAKPVSPFAERQRSPASLLHRMGLRLSLPTEPDAAANQLPGLPITRPTLVERGEPFHAAVEDAADTGDHVVSGGLGEPTMLRHREGPRWSIVPRVVERALTASRPSHTLPQVKKVTAFVHRLLGAPVEQPQEQGLTPLAVPAAATHVHPRDAAEEAASTPVARVGAEWSQKRMEPLPPVSVSARDAAARRPSPTHGGRQFAAWLHSRRYQPSRVSPAEQAYPDIQADVPVGLPGPTYPGPEVAASSVAPPPPEHVFPSSPAMRPASPADAAVHALQSAASHNRIMPQHELQQQRVPVSSPPSQTEPTTAMPGFGLDASHQLGGPPQGAIAGPGFAFAPLERPQASAVPSRSAQGAATGEPTTLETTEEAAEANLERLALNVYAILRRRIAWESDRKQVLIS